MRVHQSNKAKQSQRTRLIVAFGATAFFLAAVMMINVSPGNQGYNWESYVRIEESHKNYPETSTEAKIKVLQVKKTSLLSQKISSNATIIKQLDKNLELHKSLLDYEGKLELAPKSKQKEISKLEQKIETIEENILKLKKQNLQ